MYEVVWCFVKFVEWNGGIVNIVDTKLSLRREGYFGQKVLKMDEMLTTLQNKVLCLIKII